MVNIYEKDSSVKNENWEVILISMPSLDESSCQKILELKIFRPVPRNSHPSWSHAAASSLKDNELS